MAGEKKLEKTEQVATGLKSAPFNQSSQQSVALGKDGIPSESSSSISSSSGDLILRGKGETKQASVAQKYVYPRHYHYPGYVGTFSQVTDPGQLYATNGSYTAPQLGPQKQGLSPRNGHLNSRSNGRMLDKNNGFQSRENTNRSREFESSTGLTCGPRAHNKSTLSNQKAKNDPFGLRVQGENYNLEEFETKYENSKFYVIKSYSEDDVHKSIKYDVWSSTTYGNKKLNAAFHEAEETKCPVFLFFSVNESRQFVGLAEMVGQVDFNKDMDFWQVDKWTGFFPVKWHIIKDIPNVFLQHIRLENNDNRAVTYSRDTQEIALKRGLEMLNIFKRYSAKTSILDDLDFYEDREKAMRVKRCKETASRKMEIRVSREFYKPVKAGERSTKEEISRNKTCLNPSTSIINGTRNLSLN